MKRIITLCILCNAFYGYASGVTFAKPASWETLLRQAKAENKYIFVDFYATWCGPCKLMDAQVFSNEALGKQMDVQFIAVRVQTDKNDKDDDYIRSWYKDAEQLASTYQINTLPTQLYFSPDGELLFRQSGFQGVGALMSTIKFTVDPKLKGIGKKIEEYKSGKREYEDMELVIKTLVYVLHDMSLARRMIADYNINYLNHITDTSKVLTRDNVDIAVRLRDTISPSDQIVKMIVKKGFKKVDDMANWPNVSNALVSYLAEKFCLENKLWKNGKVLDPNPNWVSLENAIKRKYSEVDAAGIVYLYRLGYGQLRKKCFYLRTGNQKMMDKYVGIQAKKHIDAKQWWGINSLCWDWYVRFVSNKESLRTASRWMDTCLKIGYADSLTFKLHDLSGALDTKAVLCYKLGQRKLAIQYEYDAIAAIKRFCKEHPKLKEDQEAEQFLQTITQMEKGEKTYLDQHVVYPPDWKLID